MTIDLAQSPFWFIAFAMVLVLTPLAQSFWRRWAQAALNTGFLFLLLQQWTLVVLCGVLAALVVARLVARRNGALETTLLGLASLGLLALFILHKRPDAAAEAQLYWLSPILSAIGFSYVALRLVEFWRAAFEGRLAAASLPDAVNYLLPFHMLAAGPIQAYDEFAAQPQIPEKLSFDQTLNAVGRVVGGLFKKYVLAHIVMQMGSSGWGVSGFSYFVELHMHYLWVYLDFSAYSDIAVGVGTLMGVATPENFNRPYLARNITVFWERWHISLSMWLRRNLFVPIQLALVRRDYGALSSAIIAIGVAFTVSGLWHGLTWGFLGWGLLQAAGLITCHFYGTRLKKILGPQRFKQYHANPWIRIAATLITIEFFTYSLLLVGTAWKSAW